MRRDFVVPLLVTLLGLGAGVAGYLVPPRAWRRPRSRRTTLLSAGLWAFSMGCLAAYFLVSREFALLAAAVVAMLVDGFLPGGNVTS